jgi:hypothetical protein
MLLREIAEHDDVGVRLVLGTAELRVDGEGALDALACGAAAGEEVAFALRISGGLQPSRVGGAMNPLARVVADAVTLRPVGVRSARFVAAAGKLWGAPPPPTRPRWRLFRPTPVAAEVRFSALLVTREGDAAAPRRLHLKLFCPDGELYLDVDTQAREIALVEKDPEFRPALLRALAPLAPPG